MRRASPLSDAASSLSDTDWVIVSHESYSRLTRDACLVEMKGGYLEYKPRKADTPKRLVSEISDNAMVMRTIILHMSMSEIEGYLFDKCHKTPNFGDSETNCRLPLHLLLELEER
jgi:hypothetical protein